MKGDLLNYITIDGENLVELDIANSQFSILSYIVDDLDDEFISLSRSGNLYSKIEKNTMFRIAFDKVKSEYDYVRETFPKTMSFIDNFKNINGYDKFSNLLQRAESKIMIDYVMNNLIKEGYTVLPIHDAFRVKESELELVKNRVEELFNEIGFKCLLRNKDKKEIVKHSFKGIGDVYIERSVQDKETFKSVLNDIKNENGGISEQLAIIYLSKKGWDKYKIDYYYYNWDKNRNKIKNIE
jgi:hypothetical protein